MTLYPRTFCRSSSRALKRQAACPAAPHRGWLGWRAAGDDPCRARGALWHPLCRARCLSQRRGRPAHRRARRRPRCRRGAAIGRGRSTAAALSATAGTLPPAATSYLCSSSGPRALRGFQVPPLPVQVPARLPDPLCTADLPAAQLRTQNRSESATTPTPSGLPLHLDQQHAVCPQVVSTIFDPLRKPPLVCLACQN